MSVFLRFGKFVSKFQFEHKQWWTPGGPWPDTPEGRREALRAEANYKAQLRRAGTAAEFMAGLVRNERKIESDYRAAMANDPCVYCGGEPGAMDHIEARSTGGTDVIENVAPICKPCNSRKSDRTLLAHLLRQKILFKLADQQRDLEILSRPWRERPPGLRETAGMGLTYHLPEGATRRSAA